MTINMASLVAQMVKNLPAMQEIQVPSLLWENPVEDPQDPTDPLKPTMDWTGLNSP